MPYDDVHQDAYPRHEKSERNQDSVGDGRRASLTGSHAARSFFAGSASA